MKPYESSPGLGERLGAAGQFLAHSRLGRIATRALVIGTAFMAAEAAVLPAVSAAQDQAPATPGAPDLTPPDPRYCPQGWVLDGIENGAANWDCPDTPAKPKTPAPAQENGGDQSDPAVPAPAQEPEHSHTRPEHKKVSHYNFNQNEWNGSKPNNDCGLMALTDAVSYARQAYTSPTRVWPHINRYYSTNGVIRGSSYSKGAAPNAYMHGAAPAAAREYGLKAERIELDEVTDSIRKGGAVIMLAAGYSGSPITQASHYFESDETRHGKVRIHDPNQASGRTFNNSWRSISWLRSHHVLNQAWVIAPKNAQMRGRLAEAAH